MQNISLELPHQPGALARFGEALGQAGISLEGGGVFMTDGRAIANFLVADGAAAAKALASAGLEVMAVRDVLVLKLRQGQPGQLGKLSRRMADAGVNLELQYSDHHNQLVLIADDMDRAGAVARTWMEETRAGHQA